MIICFQVRAEVGSDCCGFQINFVCRRGAERKEGAAAVVAYGGCGAVRCERIRRRLDFDFQTATVSSHSFSLELSRLGSRGSWQEGGSGGREGDEREREREREGERVARKVSLVSCYVGDTKVTHLG